MKRVILALFAVGTLLSSCSNNGTQVEATDAENVEVNTEAATVSYGTVKAESSVAWRASHLAGVEPRFGKIFLKGADLSINDGKVVNAAIELDMASFTVENFEDEESKTKLTGHLQGDDFFKIAQFPTAKFELTGVKAAEGDFNSEVTGNLTILAATKSISFKANLTVSEMEVSIKSEDFAVNRTDWGLVYNVEGSEGVPADYLIANDIGFTIDVTVTK
jgi:polyisoprenoid-binding protein YceI